MSLFGYKNISKTIMVTTILIILSNTLLISLVYYYNQLDEYHENLKALKEQNIQKQKYHLRDTVIKLVEMIEYKYDAKEITQRENEIKEWLKSLPFDKEKSDYIFVYKLLDKRGGDKFAIQLVNPNRPDLIGKYLSTKYKDIKGFAFRKAFLEDINRFGESFVRYTYKKTNNRIEEKISYMYYYQPLDWIIAKGVYIDDIRHEIANQTLLLKQKVIKQIRLNIFIFILISALAIAVTYAIGRKIENIIREKDGNVKKTTKALAILNRELDSRVKQEVEKNKEQERIMMQKSKFIALGEMISLIAHQWRQPISELSAIIMNLKMHYRLGKIDREMMERKSREIDRLLEYMSKTIDDFRNFFRPNKTKEYFTINDSIQRVLLMTRPMLTEHKITVTEQINTRITILGYQSEFEQVLLSLITNAKDAMKSDGVNEPEIAIDVWRDDATRIRICDNAHGIDKAILEKIFTPYFTTKEEAEGTGLGLYMAKIIIEQNMGGELNVQSDKHGSCFTITFA